MGHLVPAVAYFVPSVTTRRPVQLEWRFVPIGAESSELTRLAQEGVHAGRLPPGGSGRTWAGAATGRICTVCGARIEDKDVEYEVEWLKDGVPHCAYFHIECYRAWNPP